METITIWLLVLVINSEMVEHKTYETRSSCMFVGAGLAAQAVWIVPPKVSERINPYAPRQQVALDGFFCEKQEPEKVTKVTPVCLAPTRECS